MHVILDFILVNKTWRRQYRYLNIILSQTYIRFSQQEIDIARNN